MPPETAPPKNSAGVFSEDGDINNNININNDSPVFPEEQLKEVSLKDTNNNDDDDGYDNDEEDAENEIMSQQPLSTTNDDDDNNNNNDDDNNNNNNIMMISHVTRSDLSPMWRYGMVLYILAILALLLASDIGSGIRAITVTVPAPGDIWSQQKETIIADESIFSSIRQLWDAGSYALAVFIGISSIAWPYVKLLLTLYAWMVPFAVGRRQREKLIYVLDLLGKWSFADVLVWCQLVVAFRATIPVGAGTTLEVYMLALWGFYGFVVATMLGLIGTHVILHHHRHYLYHVRRHHHHHHHHHGRSLPGGGRNDDDDDDDDDDDNDEAKNENMMEQEGVQEEATNNSRSPQRHQDEIHWTGMSTVKRLGYTLAVLGALAAYLVGCSLPIMEISRQRGDVETTYLEFSIITVGAEYVDSTMDGSGGDKWIQIVWFLLTLVMPILSALLLCCVLVLPLPRNGTHQQVVQPRHERLYLATEIAYCWSSSEVTVLSCLFAVLQIPEVGGGFVDSGCNVCYLFGSKLLMPAFIPLTVGALTHSGLAIWLFRKFHQAIYFPHELGTVSRSTTEKKEAESFTAQEPAED